jgi:hypothetical protein
MAKLSFGLFIALVATATLLTIVTAGVIVTQTLPSSGIISTVGVGVYTDSSCTTNCTSISWGSLSPGDSTSRTVYVLNTGTLPVTLTMDTDNWLPTNAVNYLTVTWNRQNHVLNAGQSVSATITLSADSDTGDLASFSFNIIITGAE